MNDEEQDPFARIAAAKLILDRGLGKLKEVELPPEPVQKREIAPEDLGYMLRVARIDHYQQQGWQIPPDLSRYEAALRILREPEEGSPRSQELGSGQPSKQFNEDAPAQPAAVKNGHNGALPPTHSQFGNWK